MAEANTKKLFDELDPRTRETVLAFSLIGQYYGSDRIRRVLSKRYHDRRYTEYLVDLVGHSPLFDKDTRPTYSYRQQINIFSVNPQVAVDHLEELSDVFFKKWESSLLEGFGDYENRFPNEITIYFELIKTIRDFKLTGRGTFSELEEKWEQGTQWDKDAFDGSLRRLFGFLLRSKEFHPLLGTLSRSRLERNFSFFCDRAENHPFERNYEAAQDFMQKYHLGSPQMDAWFQVNYSFFTEGPDERVVAAFPSQEPEVNVCSGLYLLQRGDYKKAVRAFSAGIKAENEIYYGPRRSFYYTELYNTLFFLSLVLDRSSPAVLRKVSSLSKKFFDLDPSRIRSFGKVLFKYMEEGKVPDENISGLCQECEYASDFVSILQLSIAYKIFGSLSISTSLQKVIRKMDYVPPFLLREALSALDPHCEGLKKLNERFPQPLLLREIKRTAAWEIGLEKLLELSKTFDKATSKNSKTRIVYLLDPEEFSAKPYLQKSRDGLTWNKGSPIVMSTFMKGMPEMDETDKVVSQMALHVSGLTYVLEGPALYYELAGCGRTFHSLAPAIPFDIERGKLRVEVKKEKDGTFSIQNNLEEEGVKTCGLYASLRLGDHAMEVFKCTEKQLQAVNLFDKLPRIPAEGENALTQILENISSEIPVSSELLKNSQTLPLLRASSEITFRFQPDSAGAELTVRALIRPALGCELTLQPAKGLDTVAANVNKVTTRLQRNLKEEQDNLNTMLSRLEAFDAWKAEEDIWVLDTEKALEFMEVLRENQSISRIEWPEGVKLSVKHSPIDFSDLKLNLHSVDRWFSLDGTVMIDGKTQLKINEILDRLKDRVGNFICLEGKEYVAITQKLRKQLEWLQNISTKKKDKLNLSRFSSQAIEDLRENGAEVDVDQEYEDLQTRIEKADEKQFQLPKLSAELRGYQEEGFRWLSRLAEWGAGAILADDMGLGKTIQAIALLSSRRSLGTSLVVVPTSVLFNWKREINRFAPSLKVGDFNSGLREEILKSIKHYDVVLCTYGVLASEIERLAPVDWNVIILDEAHFIKNKATQTSHAVMKLKSKSRVLLSGTPIQNHLSEIWNLFEFANPGYLGSFQQFGERFILPIEKKKDKQQQLLLKQLISPFILRRTKADVLDELPEKTELTIPIELSEEEMAVYENIRTRTLSGLQTEKVNPIEALMALTKLRQAACNTRLVDKALKIPSTKTQVFLELVKGLIENNHRALVFSQFTSHLALIKEALDKEGIKYLYMDGSVPASQRIKLTEEFQDGAAPLFLISLKAGGTGLNLTGADYVIHLDPWWNPAVEDQASDRAYRIGQKRPVTIYKLIAQNTVEEKIIELHKTKKNLADALLEGADVAKQLTKEEILELLQLSN